MSFDMASMDRDDTSLHVFTASGAGNYDNGNTNLAKIQRCIGIKYTY